VSFDSDPYQCTFEATGDASMTLMGPTSRRMAVLPQRLLEKVLTPLVVHSQIWLPGGLGAGPGGVCSMAGPCAGVGRRDPRAALDDVLDGDVMFAGAVLIGILGVSSAVARLATDEFVWLDARAGVVLPVEPTAMAIAMAAMESPPKIHGRRSLSSVINGLSSCQRVGATNMTDCQRIVGAGSILTSMALALARGCYLTMVVFDRGRIQ